MPAPRNYLQQFVHKSGGIGPYDPTWRDKIARMITGDEGLTVESERLAKGLIGSSGLGQQSPGIVDFVPGVGTAAQGVDASEHLARGNGEAAAWDLGSMAVPYGIGKGVKKLASSLDFMRMYPNLFGEIQNEKAAASEAGHAYHSWKWRKKHQGGMDDKYLPFYERRAAERADANTPSYTGWDSDRGNVHGMEMDGKVHQSMDHNIPGYRTDRLAADAGRSEEELFDRDFNASRLKSEQVYQALFGRKPARMNPSDVDADRAREVMREANRLTTSRASEAIAQIERESGRAVDRAATHGARSMDAASDRHVRRMGQGYRDFYAASPPPRNRLNMLAPLAFAPAAYQYDRER